MASGFGNREWIEINSPPTASSAGAWELPPGWLREAAQARQLPRAATWFGRTAQAESAALAVLRRAGWAGNASHTAPLIPGLGAPLLLLHEEPAAGLPARVAQAVQRHATHWGGGDGSVRFILIGLLLPAVQKIREAGNRYPPPAPAAPARYPPHFHQLGAPAGTARQSTLVLEI